MKYIHWSDLENMSFWSTRKSAKIISGILCVIGLLILVRYLLKLIVLI